MIVEKILNYVNHDSIVVDIGVNYGQETFMLAGIVKKIYAFEPNPNIINFLQKKIQQENILNVDLVEKAVSNKEDCVDFVVTSNEVSSSFVQDCIINHDKYFPGVFSHPSNYTIKVKTISLDQFFKNNEEKIDFIKMDAQGAEPYILEGGIKFIQKHKPNMILEWFAVPNDKTEWAFEFLKDLGYEIYYLSKNNQNEIKNAEMMYCDELWRKGNILDIFCKAVEG